MNFRVETAVLAALNFSLLLIEGGERGVHLAQLRLKLGETLVVQWGQEGEALLP